MAPPTHTRCPLRTSMGQTLRAARIPCMTGDLDCLKGSHGYLNLDKRALRRRCESWIVGNGADMTTPENPPVYEFADLTLDTGRRAVLRDGQALDVGTLNFDLL